MTTLTLERNARIATNPAILMKQRNMLRSKLIVFRRRINPVITSQVPKVPPKYSTLQKEVCNAFGIPEENLFLHCRKREIVNARQVYVFLLRQTKLKDEDPVQTALRQSEVIVGKHITFDHATVYHCERTAQNQYDTEPNIRTLVDRLMYELVDGKLDMPKL